MPSELDRFLATVLFADMVGYSRLMDENEGRAISFRKKMERVVRQVIPEYRGQIIQFYGDGVLALFPNTYDAVKCAQLIQQQLREKPVIPVRIGIHTGEVTRDSDNIYGDPVNIASRIESFAVPGSVLFSDKVHDDLRNQPDIRSTVLGTFQFKNISHPVGLYALTGEHLVVPNPRELRGKGEEKKHSIAVLPFVNISPDPENEYFSDGMAEELLNALTKVKALRVTARTSSFVYKGHNLDVREIGTALGVETVLEGSVRKAGNRVRITAQLIDTANGYHLLSETYDRKLDDIFAVQDDIAHNIADLLLEKLGINKPEREQLVERTTDNLEAYQLYLKGLFYWSKYNPNDARKALAFFEQATRLDPMFSTAWTAISYCYSFLGATEQIPAKEAFPIAWDASQQALLLDDRMARAYCAQGLVHLFRDWDLVKAELAFLKAGPLANDDAFYLYGYSFYLLARGRFQEAITKLEEALQLDPIALVPNFYLTEAYIRSGQYEAAIQLADQTLEMHPYSHYLRILKGWAFILQKKYREGLSLIKYQLDADDPVFPEFVATRGYTFARLGETERARGCLQRLDQLYENNPGDQLLTNKALVLFALQEKDKAFDLLYTALEQHMPSLILLLHAPQWQAVRKDPRFPAFRKKMGVRE